MLYQEGRSVNFTDTKEVQDFMMSIYNDAVNNGRFAYGDASCCMTIGLLMISTQLQNMQTKLEEIVTLLSKNKV